MVWCAVKQALEFTLTPSHIEYVADAIAAAYEREFNKSGIPVMERKTALGNR